MTQEYADPSGQKREDKSPSLENSPYADEPIPFISQSPSVPAPTSRAQTGLTSEDADSPPQKRATLNGGGALIGAILGGLIGTGIGLLIKGDLLLWGGGGALAGLILVPLLQFLFEGYGSWLAFEGLNLGLDEVFGCCELSLIFIIASTVLMGGFLWQNLLLMSGGGTIMLVLVGIGCYSSMLKKQKAAY